MPPRIRPSITLRFRCALPVDVTLGSVRWRIEIGYYSKGHRAQIIATSSNGRSGNFADGREAEIRHALSAGIHIPVGTIRHCLAMALAADGRAVIKSDLDEKPDDVPM